MGYKALIIEDDHALADVLRMKLTRDGHTVTIARHQREAYHLLDTQPFDFVLLDLRLPTYKNDMDPNTEVGFAILDHIRARVSQDELPVIVMTAYEETSQTAVRALKALANDYIQKPFQDSPIPLDEKLAGIIRHIEAAKASKDGRPVGSRHKIRFLKDCVEINGIRIHDRFHVLLFALGSRSLMVTPTAASRNGSAMPGKELAQLMQVEEATVRQYVTRFRKSIADEHRKLKKGAIGQQDIIRNNRDWNGYELNFDTAYISRE